MALSEDALMWVEKYRPKTLDEVVGLKDIVRQSQQFYEKPQKHAAPYVRRLPGTGKTTLAPS
jgi:replication factor C small subunit